MSAPHQPIDLDPAPGSVIEFGSSPQPRRPWSAAGFGHGLAADRRVVPLAAALAAVAAFASLVSEWQLTTVDRSVFSGGPGQTVLPVGIGELGALGAGYLVGIFGVVTAVVFTLAGPASGRRHARLAGLSVAGTLLGVVVALVTSLSARSRAVSFYVEEEEPVRLAYGRGVWCALAAVSFALLALYLAGRHLTAPAPDPENAENATEEPPPVWSWRRPSAGFEDREIDEPMELTVAPAKPFTSLADDRDKPTRS